uniref:Uncharacterized protein n=1 Tax=viral metagenome TaxID=1070528 RepID=A0A6C0IQI6_9ZZZZ
MSEQLMAVIAIACEPSNDTLFIVVAVFNLSAEVAFPDKFLLFGKDNPFKKCFTPVTSWS